MTSDDDLLAHLGINISGGGQLKLGMGIVTLFTYISRVNNKYFTLFTYVK